MKKISICLIFVLYFISNRAKAQYADLGTGSLKNEIWWFNWAGFSFQNGGNKTFSINDGLEVKVTFSNFTAEKPQAWTMNTWSGAILHLLYDFSDSQIQPAILDNNSSSNCGFTVTFSASRNGTPVPFTIVTADAEASDQNEITTFQTDGTNWQTIDFFKNSNQVVLPLAGCGTSNVAINNTYAGQPETGQNPILATYSTSSPVSIDVLMNHGITTGGMAVTFGILESVDRGDLPASYGVAQHEKIYQINNSCNFSSPLPEVTKIETLNLGAVAGDADPIQNTDDNSAGVDEDGVKFFPVYDGKGNYSVDVITFNKTGVDSYLSGWFDFNRNGKFDSQESVYAVVSNNTNLSTLTWANLPKYLPEGSVDGYGFRFRISSDKQAITSAAGFARDGEIEDYFIASEDLCSIKIKTIPDTIVCPGESVQLLTDGGEQYKWEPDESVSNLNIASPFANPKKNSVYIVTGFNPQGCSARDTVNVFTKISPVVQIIQDTTVCLGNSVILYAQGGINYVWSTSDGSVSGSNPSLTVLPQTNTRYYVLVGNSENCKSLDSVNIEVHSFDFKLYPQNNEVCKNESIRLEASGGSSYRWLMEDSTVLSTESTFEFIPEPNHRYFIQFSDSICQLTKNQEVNILIDSIPKIIITKSNEVDCFHPQATLYATGADSYIWNNSNGTIEGQLQELLIKPLGTSLYYLTGYGSNGCSAKDSILVIAAYDSTNARFPIPSAFTPNNDRLNDCFRIKNWPGILDERLEIFNRWGEKIFASTNPDACWDGTFKGANQPEGVYVFQISAKTVCGSVYRKGTVILLR